MSKAALKRAREAIAAKQWARALTLVDDIVTAGADADSAEDASATRYMALVFRALCLQNIPGAAGGKPDLDKAIDSYEQAIAMDARNPLAFQVNAFAYLMHSRM